MPNWTIRTAAAVSAVCMICSAGAAPIVAPSRNFTKQRTALVAEIRRTSSEYPGLAQAPHFIAALHAIGEIPREEFVPADQRQRAYRDIPLPIGYGETISDPYIVAVMTAAVGVGSGTNVLEIGTGSGYQAAVLSVIGARVHTIEIVDALARSAADRLVRLGFRNVSVRSGDGFAGWPEFAPYDAIIVTAGAAEIPQPLIAQLKIGGKLVMPVGPEGPLEQLILVSKTGENILRRCSLGPAMFVPLTGRGARPGSTKGLYDRSVASCFPGQTAVWR